MRVRAIEPCARDQDSVRLRAAAVGPARHEDMKLLARIDAALAAVKSKSLMEFEI